MRITQVLWGMLLCTLLIGASVLSADDTPERVQAVSWEVLAKCLPDDVNGLEAGEIDGGTMSFMDPSNPTQPFSYSVVEKPYTSGKGDSEKKIVLQITDTGYNKLLAAPFFGMSMEYDGPDGSLVNAEVAGYPAKVILEKEDGEVTDVQYLVLVGDRFMVSAEGNDNVSQAEVEIVCAAIDYKALTAAPGETAEKAE